MFVLFLAHAVSASQVEICSDNNYALCSHALCQCLGASGNLGVCEGYGGASNPDQGWAVCECPVIPASSESLAYRANFGETTSCAERETPSLKGQFPSFVGTERIPDVYSVYSLGDALEGDDYGTKSAANTLTCDDKRMMTFCLDMPCVDDGSGGATCYCQNVLIADPPANFLTFGGDCESSSCDTGDKKIWSAASLPSVIVGSRSLTEYIQRNGEPGFSNPAKDCLP